MREELIKLLENSADKWSFIKKYKWMWTVFTTLSVVAIFAVYGGYYMYKYGVLSYWNIENMAIYESKEDILFRIIFNIASGVFLIAINMFPYRALTTGSTKKDRMVNFIKWAIKVYFVILGILLVCSIIVSIIEWGIVGFVTKLFYKNAWLELVMINVKYSLLFFLTLFMTGIAFGVSFGLLSKIEYGSKGKAKNSKIAQGIKNIVVTIAAEAIFICMCGMYFASVQTDFKMLDSGEIIIYEDPNIMVASEIVEDENSDDGTIKIDNKIQRIIDKKGVRTKTVKFDKVKKLI